MRFLIVTGGTGGHIFPAISVAEEIRRRSPDAEFLFMGALARPGTKKALKQLGFAEDARVVHLPAVGMPRGISVGLASFGFRLLMSFDRSVRRIASFRPNVAVGFGSFGSFAPLLAAKARGVPIAIHEANAVPGRANVVLSRFSDKVLVNFPGAADRFRNGNVEAVGMPLRKEFTEPRDRFGALAKLKLSGTRFTLLVAGGSQGARTLNREMCGLLPAIEKISDGLRGEGIQLIHLTGRDDYRWVRACYDRSSVTAYVAGFEPRMKLLYDAADLVVSRAGASSVAEIIQARKPAILVPFPYATEKHQEENARFLEENGGAVVLRERVLPRGRSSIPALLEKVKELMDDRARLEEMAENNGRLANGSAAAKIVDVLFKVSRHDRRLSTRAGQGR